VSENEALLRKLRDIKAEFRRSQPAFALMSYGAVHLAINPWIKLQSILAKANKKAELPFWQPGCLRSLQKQNP